jgi:methyl-accepting chemotaxis protein
MEDNRLERIENKVDKLNDKLQENAIHTAENTASLKEHMQQTIMVREELKEAQKQTQAVISYVKSVEDRIDKLSKFKERVIGAMWIGALIVGFLKIGGPEMVNRLLRAILG